LDRVIKKVHCHHFWAAFINFNFFRSSLKNEIRGQFITLKKLMGKFVISKQMGLICNFWEIYWGSIWKIWGSKCKIL